MDTLLTMWALEPSAAVERVRLLRRLIGLVVVTLLCLGPYGAFLATMEPLAYQGAVPLGVVGQPLRWCCVGLGIALAVDIAPRVTTVSLAVTFAAFNYYAAGFGPMWSYNTHLNTWLFALALVGPSPRRETAALLLSVLQFDVGLIYLQAGVAKIMHGGAEWFLTGATARGFAALHGSPFGARLLSLPGAGPTVGLTTGIFELGFLPALFTPLRRWLGLVGMSFHIAAWMTLGISFWHLWVFFPVLFGVGFVTRDSPSPSGAR